MDHFVIKSGLFGTSSLNKKDQNSMGSAAIIPASAVVDPLQLRHYLLFYTFSADRTIFFALDFSFYMIKSLSPPQRLQARNRV
ncbi:hypothetical protein [Paenibacillus dendritiformis]|uniref:hypothetical protein n=1 Tax=Paenibacillus dendritiformis TaxID=130049 RepID=UPI00387E0A27